jgi:putative sigma-54 modulation protein
MGAEDMKITIVSPKITVSQDFKYFAETKAVKKLERFFEDDAETKITLRENQNKVTVEVIVKHKNLLFKSEQTAEDKKDALAASVDKIIRQIRKNKTKVAAQLRDTAFNTSFDDIVIDQPNYNIIRTKVIEILPMAVDEAILQMNLLGHSFFVFKNTDNGILNVVYKRNDGQYGLIVPEK